MEQLQWGYSLFAGLEGCELDHHRPSGGDANGAQHVEAGPGLTTWTSLSNHNEGFSVYNHCVHRCQGSYDRLNQKTTHTQKNNWSKRKHWNGAWLKCLSSFPTVPSTSQITFSRAISSTSISFEWSNVTGADSYILFVEKLFSSPLEQFNWTFTTLSGKIEGLAPSTTYNCYLFSSNSAGRGAKSNTKTIMTCKWT